MASMFGVRAASSGVLPSSDSRGRSAAPSGTRTAILSPGMLPPCGGDRLHDVVDGRLDERRLLRLSYRAVGVLEPVSREDAHGRQAGPYDVGLARLDQAGDGRGGGGLHEDAL